jgi:hypothetical protein
VPGNCTLLRITDHLETLLEGPPIGVGGKEGSVDHGHRARQGGPEGL